MVDTPAFGPVGAALPASLTELRPVAEQRAAARHLESLGYGGIWLNESLGGKDVLAQAAVLLAATERVVVGTAIANVWARPPIVAHGGAAYLADAYPGRFVLGLGVGYPQQAESVGRDFGRPLATMRAYVEGMRAPTFPPALAAPYPLLLGANGPRMQALAAEVADGAMPALRTPEDTAATRALIGPDRLLVVFASAAQTARPHLDAGADHVILGPGLDQGFEDGMAALERAAPTQALERAAPTRSG